MIRHSIGTRRAGRAAITLAYAALLVTAASGSAGAKPRPEPPAKVEPRVAPRVPQPLPLLNRDERLPEGYQDLVRRLMARGPGDTLGDGAFTLAEGSFHAGAFDEAGGRYADFAQRKIFMFDGRVVDEETLQRLREEEDRRIAEQARRGRPTIVED